MAANDFKLNISGAQDSVDSAADLLGGMHPDAYHALRSRLTGTPIYRDPSLPPQQVDVKGTAGPSPSLVPAADTSVPGRSALATLPMSQGSMNTYGKLASPVSSSPMSSTIPLQAPLMGNVAHHRGILGTIGEIAGSALVPNLMKWIPKTDQHNNLEELLSERRAQAGAELGKTGAETTELGARARREDREDIDTGAGQQDILKVYSNLLATGQYDKAEALKPHVIEYLQATEKPKAAGESKVITTEGGKLSTLGADNVLKPVMQPGGEAPAIPQSSPVPGGALDIPAAPIAGQQATAFEKPEKPTGGFDEQAYQQEVKTNPNLTREGFIENREGRIAQRQEANQERGFTHAEQMANERFQHQREASQQREQQLTSPTKTMIEMAPTVKRFVDRVENLTKQEADGLGPLKGRWSEFMTGKVGAPNPEYAKLRTDVSLLRSALLKMHVGSRGSQIMLQEFKDMLDQGKDSPENMLAALGEIGSYADDLEARGKQAQGGGTAVPAGGAPTATHKFNPQTGRIEAIQ